MKLDVWQKAVDLFNLIWRTVYKDNKVDFMIRSQIADSAQSISSNIAEGYSRRSINEYLQFFYIALASLSETLTRAIGLHESGQITQREFDYVDSHHYEIENKLLRLV